MTVPANNVADVADLLRRLADALEAEPQLAVVVAWIVAGSPSLVCVGSGHSGGLADITRSLPDALARKRPAASTETPVPQN